MNQNRSLRDDVRNPLVGLPAARQLQALPVESRAALAALLRDLRLEAQARANESWRRHKAPMAAYWKAVATYAGHSARLLTRTQSDDDRAERAEAALAAVPWVPNESEE